MYNVKKCTGKFKFKSKLPQNYQLRLRCADFRQNKLETSIERCISAYFDPYTHYDLFGDNPVEPFPDSYQPNMTATSYLKLKMKEYLLKELILQVALFSDYNDYQNGSDSLISFSKMQKYYKGLKGNELDGLRNYCIKHFPTIEIMYNEPVEYDASEIKISVKNVRNIQYTERKNMSDITEHYKINCSPDYVYTLQVNPDYPTFPNIDTFYIDYEQRFDLGDFTKNHTAFVYLEQEFDKSKSIKEKNLVPISVAPFVGFVSSELTKQSNLYTICENLMSQFPLHKKEHNHARTCSRMFCIYEEYIETFKQILSTLGELLGTDSASYISCDAFFNKMVQYEFFSSIDSKMFRMLLKDANISLLLTERNAKKPFRSIPECRSYLSISILQTFMRFNIDMNFLDNLLDMPVHEMPFRDNTRDTHIPDDKLLPLWYAYNKYESFLELLSKYHTILENFLQDMGANIVNCFEEYNYTNEGFHIDILLQDAVSILTSIRGYKNFVAFTESKAANNETLNPFSEKNLSDEETHTISYLLHYSINHNLAGRYSGTFK